MHIVATDPAVSKAVSMNSSAKPPEPFLPMQARRIALIIASALFMENLDGTALATALPTMAAELGASPTAMSMAITAYLLALAIFIPISGFMADRFGAKQIFCCAIILFMIGSVSCALAQSLWTLTLSRFGQGIGGAMMVPVGRLILLRSVPKHQLVAAMSWLLMPALIGSMAGPPVGGMIATFADWRWIFWVNLPIGMVGVVLVVWKIEDEGRQVSRPFDYLGFLLSACAIGGLAVGLNLVGPAEAGITGWLTMGGGALMVAAYVWHARRTPHPILNLTLFRVSTFRLAVIGGTLTRIAQGAQPFLLALTFQANFGLTAAQSGSIAFATAVGTFGMKPCIGPIVRRIGFRNGLIAMGILAAGAYGLCGFFTPAWPHAFIYAVLIAAGFFLSFQLAAYNALAYDEMPQASLGSAISLYSTIQQISLSFGVCIAATVLHLCQAASHREHSYPPGTSIAFWVVAGLSLCSLLANLRFAPDAGIGFTRFEDGASRQISDA